MGVPRAGASNPPAQLPPLRTVPVARERALPAGSCHTLPPSQRTWPSPGTPVERAPSCPSWTEWPAGPRSLRSHHGRELQVPPRGTGIAPRELLPLGQGPPCAVTQDLHLGVQTLPRAGLSVPLAVGSASALRAPGGILQVAHVLLRLARVPTLTSEDMRSHGPALHVRETEAPSGVRTPRAQAGAGRPWRVGPVTIHANSWWVAGRTGWSRGMLRSLLSGAWCQEWQGDPWQQTRTPPPAPRPQGPLVGTSSVPTSGDEASGCLDRQGRAHGRTAREADGGGQGASEPRAAGPPRPSRSEGCIPAG